MYPTLALLGLMLFTWGATVWATTYRDEEHEHAGERVAELYDEAA
ncbi:MAG: hypothetical protein ACREI2_05670 [Nitrospiraceae bacterium]